MTPVRTRLACFAAGFIAGVVVVTRVHAAAGTATFTGTTQTLTGDVTAARLLDQANTAYLIDPAAAGNSLITAGAASVSGNLVLNAAATIQTTNMQPLTIGSTTTGLTTVTSGGKLQLQAGGAGTGSTGTGSIYFLGSSGNTAGRFDTVGTNDINATGGTITTSGVNRTHTFTSSGTFTPSAAGSVDYLVVGGGGGGAGLVGGGGGGGGVLTGTGFTVTGQGYTVTVGGGGAGASGTGNRGTNGSNSVFSTLTATGGGGGGVHTGTTGNDGGSGGGGAYSNAGGTGTSGQGNAGGTGDASDAAGGGGGGGALGSNSSSGVGGNGGNGVASSISGTSTYYGGGGGGGGNTTASSGGSGGGGAGAISTNAPGNGTINTGGGGGGARSATGGTGGSGIVIIRYSTYGTLILGATNTSSSDLAEYYVTGDQTIEAGDVVTMSNVKLQMTNGNGEQEEVTTKGVLRKTTTPYDRNLIGVISTNPGVLMGSIDGENKEDKRMLALAGRAPVKIDPDSPAIAIGDFLTSSTKPGLAIKATRPGYVVARALEAWQPGGPDSIEAFIQLTYSMGDIDPWGNFRTLTVDTLNVNQTLEVRGVNVMDEINDLKRRLEALEKR